MSGLPYDLAVFAERNRNQVYDVVIEAIEKAARERGVTQKQIAETVGRKPPQISAWLSGPANWTLDTVSHLLRAVGATMEYKVVFDDERRLANEYHEASASPLELPPKRDPAEWINRVSQRPNVNEKPASSALDAEPQGQVGAKRESRASLLELMS